MLLRLALFPLLIALSGASLPAVASARPTFVYDDLDRFAAALREVDGGAPAVSVFAAYIAGASPAYPFFAERYGATGESLARAFARRPRHYHRVAQLRPWLERQEASILRGINQLNAIAPGESRPAPIFYLVGHAVAGGLHARLSRPVDGHERGVAVMLELLSMAPDTDMSEWPGRYSGGYLEDIPHVVVHEMMHYYQGNAQGMANYVSIYQPGPNNIYLALAIREGCADYVTHLATGTRRRGDQQSYGLAHERELWRQFRAVMDQPASFEDGWFGALNAATPDWPPQIGYWLGSRMCQAFHEDAPDRDQAMREIFAAYRVEDMRRIAAAYARRMGE